MTRQTWTKNHIHITFGRPSIQPYSDEFAEVKSMDDVLYFYYDVNVLRDTKTILEDRTHDFPKVQNLSVYIDGIINFDMSKAWLKDDTKMNGFEREVRYAQLQLEDSFGFRQEYFYTFERHDYSVKQADEDEPDLWSNYTLTISKMIKLYDKENDFFDDSHIESVTIDLELEDLLRLKVSAENFCQMAIDCHNKHRLSQKAEYEKWLESEGLEDD